MKITAAVVHSRSGPFQIETLDLCDQRADELLVEVVASGMCATDLHGRDAYYPTQFPKVFGHEGAGIVRAVGSAVNNFRPGDHVAVRFLEKDGKKIATSVRIEPAVAAAVTPTASAGTR